MINLYCPFCSTEAAYDVKPFENYEEYNKNNKEPLRCSSCGYVLASGIAEKVENPTEQVLDLDKEYEETVYSDEDLIDDESANEDIDEDVVLDSETDTLDTLLDTVQKYENSTQA